MNQNERWPFARPSSERRLAVIVVAVFVITGSLWVTFSDALLYSLIHDRAAVARLETAKGWVFVGLAGLVIYLVTLRGAAELTKATRTISAVLNSIGDGVLLLGPDRAIAHANPAAQRMLRASTVDELCGMGAQEFSRRFRVSFPDGRPVPPDQFVSQRAFDEAGTIRYKAILHPDEASDLILSCTAASVRLEIDQPAEIVVSVMHDITATEHLDQLRDALFAETAHAIKTPITVIKSASQVLSSAVSPQQRESTTMIERQCARIDRLVENLLTLSRIRSGTLQLYPVETDLGPVIQDVTQQVRRISRAREIDTQLHESIRALVDRERFAMVMRNTIDAAARASRTGDPIAVELHRNGDDAQITVAFHPPPPSQGFDARIDYDFDDLGVARYVTTNIVEAHGGTMTEQKNDTCAMIRINLPALAESQL